jgi:hypothetical protein
VLQGHASADQARRAAKLREGGAGPQDRFLAVAPERGDGAVIRREVACAKSASG